jgi:hypothetical protein
VASGQRLFANRALLVFHIDRLPVDGLVDTDPDVRLSAAMGLRQLGDARAPSRAEIDALTLLVNGDCGA